MQNGGYMFWTFFRTMSGVTKILTGVTLSLLGLGLARAWLWWILEQVSYSLVFSSFTEYSGHLYFDIGEILGFALLAFAAKRHAPFLRKGYLLVLAAIGMFIAGVAVVFSSSLSLGWAFECFVTIFGGFGYALLLLLWLELYGSLSTKNMILAWSYSFIIGFIIRNAVTPDLFTVIAPILPIISIVMLAKSYIDMPTANLPDPKATLPSVPKKFVASLAAMAFAFGIGDAISGQNMFGLSSQIGMAIPEIIIIVGFLVFPKRFDINTLLFVAPVFITLGVGIAFFTDFHNAPSNALMYANSQTYLILAYTIGCAIAHRLKCSSVFLCGIFAAVHKLFLQIGKQMTVSVTGAEGLDASAITFLGIATLVIVLIASIAIMSDRDMIDRLIFKNRMEPSQAQIDYLSSAYRLTPKEKSLLPLIVDGMNSSEIADELFLSPSTVRVHMSNIYHKLDVHSRQELLYLLAQK